MKKISLKIIYTLLLLLPVITYAYGIENFYINATLEPDGDLRVQEYFNMNGDFNGMERILSFANENNYSFHPELEAYGTSKLYDGDDIEINEVRAVDIDSDFNFKKVKGKKFKEVSSAEVGDYGVYTLYEDSEDVTLKIFLPDRKNKAFYIDYTIKNIAVAHNDVGELYWRIPINGLREDIENLKVTVNFPENENELRVWAHGPLHGSVEKSGKTILKAKIKGVSAYSKIDVRSTFDLNVIKDTSKYSHVFALDKILNYETSAAEQANYERIQTEYQNQEKALNTLTACYETPRRECYNNAKRLIELIQNIEIKQEYTERLKNLLTLVINYEETTAKEDVTNAEEYVKYYWYEIAYNSTVILENKELKKSLLERLEVVKEKLIIQEEESYKNLKNFSITLILITLAMVIYFYNIHDKEHPSSFKHKYLREIPNHYSPATVTYLFNRSINSDSVSAELLKLINDGHVTAEKIAGSKDDYHLKINQKTKSTLTKKDNKLLSLIFRGSQETTLTEMKNNAKKRYRQFNNNWESLMRDYTKEAVSENIYVDDHLAKYQNKSLSFAVAAIFFYCYFGFLIPIGISLIGVISVPLLFFCFVFIFTAFLNGVESKIRDIEVKKTKSKKTFVFLLSITSIISVIAWIYTSIYHFLEKTWQLPVISLCISIVSIFYICIAKKRTEQGSYEYSRWKAFKNFLLDFSKFDDKEVGEVKLWQEYLVYATAMGIADKVEKAMKLKCENLGVELTSSIDIGSISDISHSINESVNSSHSSASYASNNSSSGSGGGGGFSSGGGGGGGGGGGRF